MTRANSVMWAPDRTDSPTQSASSWIGGLDDLLRRLVQAGVDDLHAGVAQRAGDDLGAAVVPVEAGLGDDDADAAGAGSRRRQRTAAPDVRTCGRSVTRCRDSTSPCAGGDG